jgi:preprotein translocase subunit SecB
MAEEQNQAPQVGFSIEKIYVKDLSVEVPNAPAIFLERDLPEVDVQLNTSSKTIADGVYENVIQIVVTAKIGDKNVFMVECHQAGLFRISGIPQEQLSMALGIGCPNIVFPYARETICDAVLRAGFPPVQLAPFNFEAEYIRQQQQAAQAGEATH